MTIDNNFYVNNKKVHISTLGSVYGFHRHKESIKHSTVTKIMESVQSSKRKPYNINIPTDTLQNFHCPSKSKQRFENNLKIV